MLNDLVTYNENDFSLNSRYLWIWNPSNIPPHMGLSVDGRYFSLKASGLDLNTDLEGILEIISRKGIPAVAVELKMKFALEDCMKTFSAFTHTIAHEVTCLNPIKSVLKQHEVMKLAELLTELDANNALGKKIAWNIEDARINLAEYSTEDIHAHLVALSK